MPECEFKKIDYQTVINQPTEKITMDALSLCSLFDDSEEG